LPAGAEPINRYLTSDVYRHQPRIGTAGWSIRSEHREAFPPDGSHLERYAARFNAVEINSSFYRPHRRATYERRAQSVGDDFRFSVKLPKTISHARFADGLEPEIARFADEVTGLGDKLGIVLVQFPPSLVYDEAGATGLFSSLTDILPCRLACEPRHISWFEDAPDAMLARLEVARVAADPAISPRATRPGGWPGTRYHRLHGAPKIYYSDYEPAALDAIADTLRVEASGGLEPWCVFDNTVFGFATTNALAVRASLVADRWNAGAITGIEPR
jgi:uncharacterized protein YecE (DUF72 family)